MGACGCARSISCFQDDLSVFKAFRLKAFKCPNKESNFFEWPVCLLNSFVSFQKQIGQLCHIVLLVVAGFLDPTLYFFSSTEVRVNGCLTICHPE